MTTPVRWGILGTATIAREAVIPALCGLPRATPIELVAIASRRLHQAQAVAQNWNIPRAHGSYDALLADPDIDAVYIPLPNHLHVPWALRALAAGKHVLCEKPLAPTVAEAQKLADAAVRCPQLKVMEAFMYRFHPQWQWARRAVAAGEIGELRTVHTCFTFFDDHPDSILQHAEWGGGALLDIGCYGISVARFLFGTEPQRASGVSQIDPCFGVDRLTSGVLEFANGVATFTCATQAAPFQRVTAVGTRGHIEIETPFNPPSGGPSRAWIEVAGAREGKRFEPCDQYAIQAELFSQAILDDSPVPIPLDDGLANLRVIEALIHSAHGHGSTAVRS